MTHLLLEFVLPSYVFNITKTDIFLLILIIKIKIRLNLLNSKTLMHKYGLIETFNNE